MPTAGFDPLFNRIWNLLNEKPAPYQTKPPLLDKDTPYEANKSFSLKLKHDRSLQGLKKDLKSHFRVTEGAIQVKFARHQSLKLVKTSLVY